ncbi:PRC-barrel domain containing protein [Cellulosimicrobium marinum]|uniref:PRC-barrel domain containing protein n=1 Tax=Cellulosimicrobium marinum TaxID=1638992 RepID=UPI001E58829D|nr:PRC-barrel domain containing protein [Cellulosimicrobium marinum]MCB7135843.1 PRC-barrel domain containing protein [Cellulosimicrobium marinum]
MILSDLLDSPVRGPDGAPLGFVVDVRLALELLDEEPDGEGGGDGGNRDAGPAEPPLRESVGRRDAVGDAHVVGILVSPRTGTSFLGYERTGVRAPWPVPQLVRRLHRGTFLVRWEDVAAVGPDGVRLADGYAEHDPALHR